MMNFLPLLIVTVLTNLNAMNPIFNEFFSQELFSVYLSN